MRSEQRNFLKKQPTQGRSRMTVEAILEAATHILTREGHDFFNTNRVAEKAGVSIASLYQYFSDKDAILAELHRRHVARTRESAVVVAGRHRREGIEVLVARIIENVINAHIADPELHRVFSRLSVRGRIGGKDVLTDDPAHLGVLETVLMEHGIEDAEAERYVWMFRTVIHAAIHEGVYDRHEDLVSGVLSNELNLMITSWLKQVLANAARKKKRASAILVRQKRTSSRAGEV